MSNKSGENRGWSPEAKAYRAFARNIRDLKNTNPEDATILNERQRDQRELLKNARDARLSMDISDEERRWTQRIEELKKIGMVNDDVLIHLQAACEQDEAWKCFEMVTEADDKIPDGIPDSLGGALKDKAEAHALLSKAMDKRRAPDTTKRIARLILDILSDKNIAETIASRSKDFEVQHGEETRVEQYDSEYLRNDNKIFNTTFTPQNEPEMLVGALIQIFDMGLSGVEETDAYGPKNRIVKQRNFSRAFFRRDLLTILRTIAEDEALAKEVFKDKITPADIDAFAVKIHDHYSPEHVDIVPVAGVFYPERMTPLKRQSAALPKIKIAALIDSTRAELLEKMRIKAEADEAERVTKEQKKREVAEEKRRAQEAYDARIAQQNEELRRTAEEEKIRKRQAEKSAIAQHEIDQQQKIADLRERLPEILWSLYELKTERDRLSSIATTEHRGRLARIFGLKDAASSKASEQLKPIDAKYKKLLGLVFGEIKEHKLMRGLGEFDEDGIKGLEDRILDAVINEKLKKPQTELLSTDDEAAPAEELRVAEPKKQPQGTSERDI